MATMHLSEYESIVGTSVISQLHQIARDLKGATVVHINSTRIGGGVAEILSWLVPLMQDLDIDASWEVILGNDEFFKVTKAFHNGLQGDPVRLFDAQLRLYEEVVGANADRLHQKLKAADFVFVHDPQPAYLSSLIPDRCGKWIWRCHIDVSHPNRVIWAYLKSIISAFDAGVFSMPVFAQRLPHPQFIVAPSIDPLSEKNCELTTSETRETVQRLGIDPDLPIITQISRFDRFKDPVGVIKAFRMLGANCRAQLVLAGGGATDDPEAAAVFDEVIESSSSDERIKVLLLPNDAHRTVNALQRASTIIVQKSIQEGFGLTVTEALWKGKPVIGGNVGGIRLQVHPHYTGFLVDTPEGAALRLRELLRQPQKRLRMGEVGRQLVRDNFLLTRQLREYLTLMLGLRRGIKDRLLAG